MCLRILILGVLLHPKASALKCYVSIPDPEGPMGTLTETQQDCLASTQCSASTIRTYVGSVNTDVKMKTCMASAGCGVSGSMNVGIARTLLRSECCSTALCNVHYPTPPATSSSPNGKTCFTCKNNDCSDILPCTGDEDRCISSRVVVGGNEIIVKGCVSKSLCVSSSMDTPGMIQGVSSQTGCCEGDLCNGATSAAVSLLLLLVAPVVSVALFN